MAKIKTQISKETAGDQMTSFTIINDELLADEIRKATSKIVFVAPGISKSVAEALSVRFSELDDLQITVILDVDPEVCRLGYGEIEGIETIKALADQHLLELRHQPGVRIGLLLTDRQTIIYSPTPLLIEAGSIQPEKPNAIVLSEKPIEDLEKSCGASVEGTIADAEIGLNVVTNSLIESAKRSLAENPPQAFDIARATRVFSSRIQYVEFSLENYRLSKKVAPIPADILGITENKQIEERLRNTFKLLDRENSFVLKIPQRNAEGKRLFDDHNQPKWMDYSEKKLEQEKQQIIKDFLYVVPRFGTVILMAQKKRFDERIEQFKQRLGDYKEAVEANLSQEIQNSIAALVDELADRVAQDPPNRYLKAYFTTRLSSDEARDLLRKDLEDAFGSVQDVFDPSLSVIYKSIAPESVQDKSFKEALQKSRMPPRTIEQLFNFYDAAPQADMFD